MITIYIYNLQSEITEGLTRGVLKKVLYQIISQTIEKFAHFSFSSKLENMLYVVHNSSNLLKSKKKGGMSSIGNFSEAFMYNVFKPVVGNPFQILLVI